MPLDDVKPEIEKEEETEEKEDTPTRSKKHPDHELQTWITCWRNFVLRHRNNNAMGPKTPLWDAFEKHNRYMKGPSFEEILKAYYLKHPGKQIMDDQKRAAKLRQAERQAKERQ